MEKRSKEYDDLDARIDAEIDAWQAKYAGQPELPYMESMDLEFEQRLMILHMSNGRRVVIPLEDVQGLADATPEQLMQWEMLGRGYGMAWDELGVSFSVSGLLKGIYGTKLWMQQLQARGGASRSEAKQQAARANEAKGGRPRKEKQPA